MRLPKLRSKTTPAPERLRTGGAGDEPAAVDAARVRARRRLVGALVLLVIGVLGFPVLFETQPRPLPVDTPIEVPRGEAPPAAARALPAAPQRPSTMLPVDAGIELAAAPPASAPAAVPAARPAPPEPAASAMPAARVPATTAAQTTVVQTDDGARARALLEGASAPDPGGARFVVQVGAYSDPGKLREARAKVEQLGLKTYTQVVENEAGKRTRVRVGPFATREEADAAATKVKHSGLPANILVL